MGSDETDLVRFLSVRDAACPRCQYNLRGLQGTACPECGAEVSVERLQADETHRRWRESRMPGDPITIAGLMRFKTTARWRIIISATGFGQKPAEMKSPTRVCLLRLLSASTT